jgi:hypothetical protein
MRWAHHSLDAVGAIGLAMGLWRVVQQTRCSTTYDEGIMVSHTWVLLTQSGRPFRDFYTQYPPGIYVLLAAIWKVFGISVMADRILSEVLRVGIALLAGVTAGRLAQRRFAVLPAALVMMWLSCIPGPPFGWLGALLAALAAMLALERALALRSRPHLVASGALLAGTFSFRHDLGIYLALALIPVGAYALAVSQPRPGARQAQRALGYLAAGGVGLPAHAPAVPPWPAGRAGRRAVPGGHPAHPGTQRLQPTWSTRCRRRCCFDPGIITRSSVQREMIQALEARKPRIAILSDANKFIEGPPDAQRHDSKLLDVYLETRYELERMVGPYKILRRRE